MPLARLATLALRRIRNVLAVLGAGSTAIIAGGANTTSQELRTAAYRGVLRVAGLALLVYGLYTQATKR